MDGVKRVPVKDAAALRKAVKDDEEFVLFEGDEPLFRCVPVAQALAKSEAYFRHYPHPAGECLYTCWRHPRVPAQAPTADATPVPTP